MDELVYRCIIIAASIILMAKPSYSQWVIVPSQTAREEKNNKDDNIDNAQYDTSDRNRRYRWLTKPDDKFSYVKGTFALIPIYKDSEYAYKYYFDDKGYLITDNISNDLLPLLERDRTLVKEIWKLTNEEIKYIADQKRGEGIYIFGASKTIKKQTVIPFENEFRKDNDIYKIINTSFDNE